MLRVFECVLIIYSKSALRFNKEHRKEVSAVLLSGQTLSELKCEDARCAGAIPPPSSLLGEY